MMRTGTSYKFRINGFTLVEIAVAILISGILITIASAAYDSWLKRHRIEVTKLHIAELENAIDNYTRIRGYLPCVAAFGIPFNDPNFGTATDCGAATAPAGTFEDDGRDGIKIRIGAVPIADLQQAYRDQGLDTRLSKSFAVDGWGRLITMAVTAPMAVNTPGYDANKGAIRVVDTQDNSLTTPDDHGLYVLVSHGKDGLGGYSDGGGVLYRSCGIIGYDAENCDENATFRKTLSYSTSESLENFDDFVSFRVKELVKIPAISKYTLFTMNCMGAEAATYMPGHGYSSDRSGAGQNPYGEQCATLHFSNPELYIGPDKEPSDGRLLYSRSFTADHDGRVIVRATIPTRSIYERRPAILAAIYLNDTEIQRAMIINPSESFSSSSGGTGVIIGSGPITRGVKYDLNIYLFMTTYRAGGSSWAGTVHLVDHAVDGVVEIMESTLE